MPNIPDPPRGAAVVNCPACGHPTNNHDLSGCLEDHYDCRWSPNDIAWFLIFGTLTPTLPQGAVLKSVTRPLGAWE